MHNQALVEYLKEDGNQPSAYGGRDSQALHWGWYRLHGIAMLNVLWEKVFRRLDRENCDSFVLDTATTNLLRQLHHFCKDGKIVKVNTEGG
jgi:hypothetical protein